MTAGRGKVSVGFGYQHAAYDTFEGLNLRQRGEGGITFYIPHTDCCSPGTAQASTPDGSRTTPPFEGDLIEAQLALRLTSDTSIVFANYGVTNRLDIGVAVPFVRVALDASVLASLQRLSTAQDPSVHAFEGSDPDERLFRMSGVASGLGDIMLRAKYAFNPGQAVGLAAAVEARVPTGDESNLLGTGGVQTRIFGIASLNRGPLSPHVNVGLHVFERRLAAWRHAAGTKSRRRPASTSPSIRGMTMSFDVLSRTLRDAGRMRLSEKTFEYAVAGDRNRWRWRRWRRGRRTAPEPSQRRRQTTRTELRFVPGDLRLYLGAAGVRFSPWRTILVTANLLFPLTEAGLRDRVTPVLGVDYVF